MVAFLNSHIEYVEKEEEPVIFKMQENGYAETRQIAPGEAPPARVYHPEQACLVWKQTSSNIIQSHCPKISGN